jgi:hypothetical protein
MGTTISVPGEKNVYIRQNDSNVQWSSNQNDWSNIIFPCTISNSNTNLGLVKINFTTNINLKSINDYFNCASDKIQFGSDTLNVDGSRPKIFIDNVTDYPGLIKNFNGSNSYNYIYIYNLEILSNNSTLASLGGWICQQQFSYNSSNNYVINCYSNGELTNDDSGGIVGYSAASNGGILNIIGCSSSGNINSEGSGGIVASYAGYENGFLLINSCWTTGIINGNNAGGIIGQQNYNVNITNCYSEGSIIGNNAGGICGLNPGLNYCYISNCYSKGNISGIYSGGISASAIVGGGLKCTCSIINCYSTGNLSGSDCGGIIGPVEDTYDISITNCYTSGTITGAIGYIVGNYNTVSGSFPGLQFNNCFSEAFTNSPGGSWVSANADTVLTGTPSPYFGSSWANIGLNQPYEIYNMGYSPYSLTNISSQDLNRTISINVMAGNSTRNGLTTTSYSLINVTGGDSGSYGTITINPTTGKISTTSETVQGTYTLYVRNTGSYNYSTVFLTVVPGVFLVTPYKKIIRVPYINNEFFQYTIENLKTEIYNQIGMPQNTICLTFKGRILEDSRMISFYNIQANDTLHISQRHPKKG